MKKIYLMGLTAAFAMSVNAQTSLKLKRSSLSGDVNHSSFSKTPSPMQVAGTVMCNTQYVAGTTMNLVFTLNLSNTDFEYGDFISLVFPAGITPNSSPNNPFASDAVDPGPDGPEVLNAIAGQTISWGNNDNNWGGIVAPASYNFTVNVTISSGLIGAQPATYSVSGDGFVPGGVDISGTANIFPAGSAIVNMQTKFVIPNNVTALNNCALGTGTIIARVVNLGNNAASNIPANYSVNGVASASIVIPGPIAPGDSVTFMFPAPYNFTASDIYAVKAWIDLALDINLVNDTASLTIVNSIPVALTSSNYVNGIETTYDYASIAQSWIGSGLGFGQSTGTVHTGTVALFYTLSGANPAATYETFNILPCMDVTSSEIYKISYWRKANTSGTLTVNGQSGIFTGTAQDAASMTNVLKAYSAITPNAQAGVWQKDSAYYTATANETRYFAIGGKGTLAGASTQVNVRIDDIMISKMGTVGIKNISATDAMSIFPNPTSGILNVTSVEVTSSIEVFNVIGEKVYSANLIKGNNVIDLSGLSNGAYFVKMNSNNQVSTKKIVLSK